MRAAELLARCLKTGIKPRQHVLVTPIVWPPTGTGTRDGPMHALEEAARRIERELPGVLAVNVVGGYSFADVRDAGLAFGIITEGDDASGQSGFAGTGGYRLAAARRAAFLRSIDLDEVLRDFKPNCKGPCCWLSRRTISAAARLAIVPT